MCLVDNKRFRFTFKPIKVYKIVAIKRETNEILSPFKFTPLHRFNFTLSGSPIKLKKVKPFDHYYYEFNGGFFHSCKNITTADCVRQDAVLSYAINNIFPIQIPPYAKDYDFVVITGWIPPFTRYATDLQGSCICSRCLILNI